MRWTLNYDYGIVNLLITDLGFAPVGWLQNYPTAMLTVIVYHIWHWLPMWTLMLTAGRKNIPEELYEAASIDGASLRQHFTEITAPLLSKLFFICLLLSSIWSLGEFEAVWLVTMTDPNQSTNIISTLGYVYTFVRGNLVMGLACYMSMLPIIVIILVILMYLMRGTK
jgi:multiple sugar transport system permease protein